jgi:hypothetical protein
MATSTYFQNRFQYARPQAIAWANSYTVSGGLFLPEGNTEGEDFLILSDHNRSDINFTKQRLENKQRMISGAMRSYHIADKVNVSWSWEMLPSRAFSGDPGFDSSGLQTYSATEYTADGGAGGVDIVKWYENHPGSFFMFLAYDRFDRFESVPYSHLGQYNEVVEVYFSDFDYSVIKRGPTTHDFWNISVAVEEV